MGLRREWAHDSTFSCLISKAQFRLSSGSLLAGPLVELSIIPSSSNLGGGHPLPSSSAQWLMLEGRVPRPQLSTACLVSSTAWVSVGSLCSWLCHPFFFVCSWLSLMMGKSSVSGLKRENMSKLQGQTDRQTWELSSGNAFPVLFEVTLLALGDVDKVHHGALH